MTVAASSPFALIVNCCAAGHFLSAHGPSHASFDEIFTPPIFREVAASLPLSPFPKYASSTSCASSASASNRASSSTAAWSSVSSGSPLADPLLLSSSES